MKGPRSVGCRHVHDETHTGGRVETGVELAGECWGGWVPGRMTVGEDRTRYVRRSQTSLPPSARV